MPILDTDDKSIRLDGVEDHDDNDMKKEKLDMADGIPHMRGLNRKQTIERSYRDQEKDMNGKGKEMNGKKAGKGEKKTGMNEKAVDCLYVGLMCCECSIQ